jgi:hypothetical protein
MKEIIAFMEIIVFMGILFVLTVLVWFLTEKLKKYD